ncbi:hypothetical protein PENTCL1PPCAC_4585, partial [Pristionchus entomophagus]
SIGMIRIRLTKSESDIFAIITRLNWDQTGRTIDIDISRLRKKKAGASILCVLCLTLSSNTRSLFRSIEISTASKQKNQKQFCRRKAS